jgi:hypothetical protein
MKNTTRVRWISIIIGVIAATKAFGHCDTLNGPVVADAKAALAKGDVTPVLKWVKPEKEAEIRSAFDRTVTVRKLSKEAAELADWYFFETLVRVHREGEGAAYTGLKANEPIDPAIEAADKALETGQAGGLIKAIGHGCEEGINARFQKVVARKAHLNQSVEAGREYVEAYVDYVHYYEGLVGAATAAAPHHEGHSP